MFPRSRSEPKMQYLQQTQPALLELILTSLNRRSENVRVPSIIVAEFEFRNIERHVFGADFVEASDDPALEDRPEALNRVGVDCADDVLPDAVINRAMRVIGKPVIARRSGAVRRTAPPAPRAAGPRPRPRPA